MLDADNLTGDLRGGVVWIGAGQLHRVLEAAAFLLSGGGATFSKTLAFSAPNLSHICCLGEAAIDRAWFPAACHTELSCGDFVGAPTH